MAPGERTPTEGFGAALRAARERARVSQDELAKRAGYKDKSAISRIEKGEPTRPPTRERVEQMAEVLDMPAGPLLAAAGYGESGEVTPAEIEAIRESVERLNQLLDDIESRMGRED